MQKWQKLTKKYHNLVQTLTVNISRSKQQLKGVVLVWIFSARNKLWQKGFFKIQA